MSAYVYRCFDPQGQLIYVGASINVEARVHVNHKTSAWWYDQIERVTSEPYPTIDEALGAEARIIRAELPRWNVKHKPTNTPAAVRDMIETIENGPSARTWANRTTLARLRRKLDAMFMDSGTVYLNDEPAA